MMDGYSVSSLVSKSKSGLTVPVSGFTGHVESSALLLSSSGLSQGKSALTRHSWTL